MEIDNECEENEIQTRMSLGISDELHQQQRKNRKDKEWTDPGEIEKRLRYRRVRVADQVRATERVPHELQRQTLGLVGPYRSWNELKRGRRVRVAPSQRPDVVDIMHEREHGCDELVLRENQLDRIIPRQQRRILKNLANDSHGHESSERKRSKDHGRCADHREPLGHHYAGEKHEHRKKVAAVPHRQLEHDEEDYRA